MAQQFLFEYIHDTPENAQVKLNHQILRYLQAIETMHLRMQD